ncbi:GmrSD restriction endonuclease domain-containing protein [Acetobacterium bakii]|uniref:GmrSD restriction endonucleases N-terminal domain-containing protein n=1 Tax=Acetobacterium bakii TaxID=52689 RepID=A0A0L6TYG2_9FIRM|nr:DUF262 domain-containing protein [Acetobacterium bakii]KNZ40605.1 hypothetical protein AKG39_16805 [Acetobacterium bakii]
MDIQTILSQIEIGSYALPEFQRGYVWNRDQVRKLMNSLYKGFPIGGLLVWVTQTNEEISRGVLELTPGSVNLILDGQQRITTLYGIIRGKAPAFFDGNSSAFTDLYFDLEEEIFGFYMPMKMKDNPSWINVTQLMQEGVGNFVTKRMAAMPGDDYLIKHMDQLNRIDNIKKVDLHIDQVAGADKTIDVVVEIFNNVNSGGTKLSKGDLSLAKICAQWPDARRELKAVLARLHDARYDFELDWLLRCITVYLTDQPYFAALGNVDINDIKDAVPKTEAMIGTILNQIGSRLGLDHNRVLGSRFSIPVMIEVIKKTGGKIDSSADWNKLLYWYIHTFLWGRYAGSTESVMAQDLSILANGDGVDGLIRQLRQNRGDLKLHPEDFWGWSTGARFYPLLYLLTRVNHARDFGSGIELSNALLGHNSSLEVHHIFPKDLLYKQGYTKSIVNALGNYTFLTKDTNLAISNKPTNEYIPDYMKKTPGAIESHWIPTDSNLLELDNYEEFLGKRRELLADAANKLLDSLVNNTVHEVAITNFTVRSATDQGGVMNDEEEQILELFQWLEDKGLPLGDLNYEITDDDGNMLAMLDVAWPAGIQQEYSVPVALMLDETDEYYKIANQRGFKYYSDIASFKEYVIDLYGM